MSCDPKMALKQRSSDKADTKMAKKIRSCDNAVIQRLHQNQKAVWKLWPKEGKNLLGHVIKLSCDPKMAPK